MRPATVLKNYLHFFSFFDGHLVHSRGFICVAVNNVQHELCTGCTFRGLILKNAVPNISVLTYFIVYRFDVCPIP
jgi:hypothetical protein